MKITPFALLFMMSFIFISSSLKSQNPSQTRLDMVSCYNGVKDSTEEGVDCGKGKVYCVPCNGEANMILNGKNYTTGVIQTIVSEVKSPTIFLDKSKAMLMLNCSFYTEGTMRSGVTLRFTFIGKLNKPTLFKIYAPHKFAAAEEMGLTKNADAVGLIVQYNKSMAFMPLHKVKEGKFRITTIDPIERKMNAEFEVKAKLSDGTPVNLSGSLTNVEY